MLLPGVALLGGSYVSGVGLTMYSVIASTNQANAAAICQKLGFVLAQVTTNSLMSAVQALYEQCKEQISATSLVKVVCETL